MQQSHHTNLVTTKAVLNAIFKVVYFACKYILLICRPSVAFSSKLRLVIRVEFCSASNQLLRVILQLVSHVYKACSLRLRSDWEREESYKKENKGFMHQVFLSRLSFTNIDNQRDRSAGIEISIFLPTTSTHSHSFRLVLTVFQFRWLIPIFNLSICNYRSMFYSMQLIHIFWF